MAQGAAAVPSFLRFLSPWVGNEILFRNAVARRLEASVPIFKHFNNVTNTAPAFKWVLSIVPIYQALIGNPPVEKLDIKQSSALTFTGAVWAYYATLIQPQNSGSRALMLCNAAMASIHGYNVFRRMRYDAKQKGAEGSK
eukprot:Opistho-1_new@6276